MTVTCVSNILLTNLSMGLLKRNSQHPQSDGNKSIFEVFTLILRDGFSAIFSLAKKSVEISFLVILISQKAFLVLHGIGG